MGEFCQLWQALEKRQNLINNLAFILKEQAQSIMTLNQDLMGCMKGAQSDHESMDKMKQVSILQNDGGILFYRKLLSYIFILNFNYMNSN